MDRRRTLRKEDGTGSKFNNQLKTLIMNMAIIKEGYLMAMMMAWLGYRDEEI